MEGADLLRFTSSEAGSCTELTVPLVTTGDFSRRRSLCTVELVSGAVLQRLSGDLSLGSSQLLDAADLLLAALLAARESLGVAGAVGKSGVGAGGRVGVGDGYCVVLGMDCLVGTG